MLRYYQPVTRRPYLVLQLHHSTIREHVGQRLRLGCNIQNAYDRSGYAAFR